MSSVLCCVCCRLFGFILCVVSVLFGVLVLRMVKSQTVYDLWCVFSVYYLSKCQCNVFCNPCFFIVFINAYSVADDTCTFSKAIYHVCRRLKQELMILVSSMRPMPRFTPHLPSDIAVPTSCFLVHCVLHQRSDRLPQLPPSAAAQVSAYLLTRICCVRLSIDREEGGGVGNRRLYYRFFRCQAKG